MSAAAKSGKLSLSEYIKAMKDHEICFEGRLLSEEWGEYTGVFNEIRRIGEIKPAEFISQYDQDDPVIVDLQVTASKLTRGAWYCLNDGDTEYGWRKEVEFPAFECFEQEIICLNCLKRRWKPIFEAQPRGQEEAERLERRRRRRKLCQCSRLQRTTIRRNDHLSRIFIRKLDEYTNHEGIQAELRDRLKRRRPDRVIGLGKTQTVRQFLPQVKSRSSPFQSSDGVYPFIVIEAKPAKASGATWGSIYRQTAFVIRTCLRLQQNLVTETGGSHQCIVWSFASIGEEWRLYAGIPQGTELRIFDLWHGTVLFPEGALQLLLIIDYLCDWACDVYRESILACLTGDLPGRRSARLTPSGTETSSQVGDITMDTLREMSLPLRGCSVPLQSTRPPSPQLFDRTEEIYEIDALLTSDLDASVLLEDTYHWRKWLPTEPQILLPTQSATVRHANQIELSSLRLIVPEDFRTLQIFLQVCFPDVSEFNAAKDLLASLTDEGGTLATSLALISRQRSSPNDLICNARIMVFSRSSLRPTDWQIARQLVILFCSKEAARCLANIAGTVFSERSWLAGYESNTETIVEAINKFHFVSGMQSASLALSKLPLCLKGCADTPGQRNYTWTRYCPSNEGAISAGMLSHTVARLASSTDEQLFCHLGLPQFSTGGILIKKHEGWPEQVPEFCFLVMDETVHFDEERHISDLLDSAQTEKERYWVGKKGAKYSLGDKDLIDRWIETLAQSAPPTVRQGNEA